MTRSHLASVLDAARFAVAVGGMLRGAVGLALHTAARRVAPELAPRCPHCSRGTTEEADARAWGEPGAEDAASAGRREHIENLARVLVGCDAEGCYTDDATGASTPEWEDTRPEVCAQGRGRRLAKAARVAAALDAWGMR